MGSRHSSLIKLFTAAVVFGGLVLSGCSTTAGGRPGYNRVTGRTTNQGLPTKAGRQETGMISFYGPGFHGKKTANGETFDQHGFTAAHRTLPFNTKVKVTIISTGKSVVVRINDRGPFKKSRILDLSQGAAEKVGLVQSGIAKARIEVL